MAYFMTTELGRRVPLDDWLGFHRDRLLSFLYQVKEHGLPRPELVISMVSAVTGLTHDQARQLVTQMESEGLLIDEGGTYGVTSVGERCVAESRAR